ncbi:MAG: hypothetical protein ACM3MK_09075 [Chitinophagales bacterium]
MADTVVSGEIETLTRDCEFRATGSCIPGPSGSITGELEAIINGREFEYTFHSTRCTSVTATRGAGTIRFVRLVYRNATVHNLTSHFTTTGATIVVVARRSSTGRRTATVTIFRPGRVTLQASGFLEDGQVSVFRQVACSL